MVTQQPTTDASGSSRSLLALYPEPERTALEGIYLSHDLRRCRRGVDPFVYSNFIASLDGRIAVADPQGGEPEIPSATANPRDWRLLLELAAPADALIVSGRYVRKVGRGRGTGPAAAARGRGAGHLGLPRGAGPSGPTGFGGC
jgi:hypothetical protein